MKKLSSRIEDYVETLLLMEKDSELLSLTELAKIRHVSLPTARSAVTKLKDMGLVLHERYAKIRLTEEGRKKAQAVYCNHKMLYRFLTEVVHISTEHAEEDACKMEHGLSQETLDKLSAFVDKCLKDVHDCR